jgi:ATP-binding cassette subfamily F protein uup
VAVLVDLARVSARSPDRALFEDLSLTISDGDRVGVIGINGTGKSTLLEVIAGVQAPERGEVRRGRGVRVGYCGQDPVLPPGRVGDAIGTGWEGKAALERLGMTATLSSDVAELSGGQSKRVALARVLVQPCELLVLDEPTNHLDLAAVAWLEGVLAAHRGGLVLVSHDRSLLDRVTTRMLELDRGQNFSHDGGYGSYLVARSERAARAASADARRQNLAQHELAWLRRGAKARSRKPQARVDAARKLIAERPERPARSGELGLRIGTPRLGSTVIECHDVGFAHPGAPGPTLEHVELVIGPDERLGIVGGNGTGKSTLLDLLAGRKDPTSGRVTRGSTVAVGYYDQIGVELDPGARLQDLVAGPHRTPGTLEDVALMEQFWFGGDLPFAPVGTLSGGERRRLQLLLVLARRPNVLLLDEPTNDLDLDTLRMLEAFLDEWPGALVVVSHDRTFLERTTERLVALRGDGSVAPVPGGLDAWLAAISSGGGASPDGGGSTPRRAVPSRRTGPSASTLHRQMREVEREIARLERSRDALSDELARATEHATLARVGSELAQVHSLLEAAEEQWLVLGASLDDQ